MSRTVSIDVFRLATLSPYFKHFIQSLGQPIDYIPRELEVSARTRSILCGVRWYGHRGSHSTMHTVFKPLTGP